MKRAPLWARRSKRCVGPASCPFISTGGVSNPAPLQCDARTLLQAISRAGGEYGQPLRVTIAGESNEYTAVPSEIQWEPRTGDVLHVDLRTVAS